MGFNVDKFPGTLDYAKLSPVLADAGYVLQAFEQNLGGFAAGVSDKRIPMVSDQRRLAVGVATKLFDYQFSATSQNTGIWQFRNTTMAATQSAQGLLLNSGSTLTTTTGVMMSTWRYFNLPGNGTLQVEFEASMSVAPLTNQTLLMGLFPNVSATALPTDGVYFKITTAGIAGVINFNGTETDTGILALTSAFTFPKVYNYRIDINDLSVDFWINDTLMASFSTVATNGLPNNFGALPLSLQSYNPGTVSGTPCILRVVAISVTQRDLATNKSWETQQAGAGLNASQGSEGQTMGTTALYSNSLTPGAGAVMTNTTAALGSGLGGQFAALPTLAANTDGVICSYQNPAGSINIIPRTLFIRGVRISSCVTTVLAGNATPVVYFYSLAYGHTTVSLATAEGTSFSTSPTTKAARRIPIGAESFAAAAAVGTVGSPNGVTWTFATPIAVNPGEFFAVVGKNVGVVTTTGVITFLISVDAFWE